MPALSARERFLLELRARHAGGKPDPAVRRTMPQGQTEEFNRYIALLNAVNVNLSGQLRCHLLLVQNPRLRFGWWRSLLALALSCHEVASLLPVGKRGKAET